MSLRFQLLLEEKWRNSFHIIFKHISKNGGDPVFCCFTPLALPLCFDIHRDISPYQRREQYKETFAVDKCGKWLGMGNLADI